MTKEIWVSLLPTQLKDAKFLFEKSLSAAPKNDCNAVTNQKTLFGQTYICTVPHHTQTYACLFDCGKPQTVIHKNDTVRLKSFSWARDCAQNREKFPCSLEYFYYPPSQHVTWRILCILKSLSTANSLEVEMKALKLATLSWASPNRWC